MDHTTIRDPVHGQLKLTGLEIKIIDTPLFQRLRNVRQLGMAHFVYPGAHHTRFEHSLGALYLVDRLASNLRLDRSIRDRLRLAALVHDIGHMAFSHDSEEVLKKRFKNHEQVGLELIQDSEIADIISEVDNPSIVAQWAMGDSYGQLISSDVGADRIDYLLRDAHYTGVAYGVIDWGRILMTLRWHEDAPVIVKNGLESAESIMLARFSMFHTVYYHHAVRITRKMFQHCLRKYSDSDDFDFDDFCRLSDVQLIERLKKESQMASDLWERRLYKRALMIPWSDLDEVVKSYVVSGQMQKDLDEKFSAGSVFVDPPASFVTDATIDILEKDGQYKSLSQISAISSSLQAAAKQRATLLICSDKKIISEVSSYAAELISKKGRQKQLKPFIS